MPRPPVETATRVLSSIYVVLVVLFAIHVVWVAIDTHYTIPTKDDWRVLNDMFSSPILDWIFRDQIGHRVPVTLLLMYVDYTIFGGHMHLPVFASMLWTGITVAILVRIPRSRDLSRDPLSRAAVAFACFLFFWAVSRHDLGWGLNQGTLLAAMLAVVSLAALGTAARRKLEDGIPGTLPILAAVAAAIGATFSSGVGFASWAGLFAVSLLIPLSARVIASLWICAAVVLVIYITGIEGTFKPPEETYVLHLSKYPGALIKFVIAFIGAPAVAIFTDASKADAYNFAQFAGAVGFAGYVTLVLYLVIRREKITPLHVFAVGLPSVALTGGFMVALNRINWLPYTAIDNHYATWSTLFWIGFAFAIPSLRRRPNFRPGLPSLIGIVLLVGLSVLLLPEFREQRRVQAAHKSHNAYISTMHLLGIRWDVMTRNAIRPMPERTYRVVERLRRDGRSFFGERRALFVGSSIASDFELADDNRCTGEISWMQLTPTRDDPVLRLAGWAIDHKRGTPIEQILVADRKGIVRGLGVYVRRDADLSKISLPLEEFPWAGFLGHPSGRGPYRAFGFLNESLICDLKVTARAIQWPAQQRRK